MKAVKFQKARRLKSICDSQTTASPGLKNWLFWFDLIRYGLQALAVHWLAGPTNAPSVASRAVVNT
jgi:hypothetical protein